MDRIEIRKSEKAFLVGVLHGNQTAEVVKEHLNELKQLAETAGATVVGQITPVSYTHLTLPTILLV